MKIYVIIPIYNEASFLEKSINSFVNQTVIPKKVIYVDDNSTDSSKNIVSKYSQKFDWIDLIQIESADQHVPGSKIINAFYAGYDTLDDKYDVICKFDADIVFEPDYLLNLKVNFENNPRLGMAAGACYVKKQKDWVLENLNRNDHIRGALKAYRKDCFLQIGKLKRSIGWDTIDELLAQYYKWEILVDETLKVKHLKPTGLNYSPDAALLQGEATYRMRLGWLLTLIIGLKRGLVAQSSRVILSYLKGYSIAKKNKTPFIVDKAQGKYLRVYRWRGILRWIKFK